SSPGAASVAELDPERRIAGLLQGIDLVPPRAPEDPDLARLRRPKQSPHQLVSVLAFFGDQLIAKLGVLGGTLVRRDPRVVKVGVVELGDRAVEEPRGPEE